MTKSIITYSALGFLSVALAGLPVCASAKDTNAPAAGMKAPAKKSTVLPIHGKLKAVDKTAKTISIGEHTLQITSETIITKSGKPAMLEDGVVGEEATASYKKGDDGKLTATKIRFGPKTDKTDKPAEKTKPS